MLATVVIALVSGLGLTVLLGELSWHSGYLSVRTLTHLLGESWDIIKVPLQRLSDLIGVFGRAKLKDGVVVESPVLSVLVLTPDLLALDAEDLHADTTGESDVVGGQLGKEGGVAHDDIVSTWVLEHALLEVLGEVVVDDEASGNAL